MRNLFRKGLLTIAIALSLILSNISVSAEDKELEIKLDGNSVASPGDTVTYKLNISSPEYAVFVEGDLETIDSKVLTLDKIVYKDFEKQESSSKDFAAGSKGIKGESTVAEFIFKVNDKTSVNSTELKINVSVCYKDEEQREVEESCQGTKEDISIKKQLSIKSNTNTLKELKINDELVAGFSPTRYDYEVIVEGTVDKAKLEASLSDTKASFKSNFGQRTVNLEYGENEFEIKVQSEVGTERIYTLKISREDNRGTNNYLDGIFIEGEALKDFKSRTLSYTVYSYKAKAIKIEAETSDEKAVYKVEAPDSMIVGDNQFKIVVSSESGEELAYNIKVINIDRDISKRLKTLSIDGYRIEFDKNTNRYEILYNKTAMSKLKVLYAVDEEIPELVNVTITPDEQDYSKLKPGDEIVISIEGIDGETQDYTIAIKKDNRISIFTIIGLIILGILIFIFIKLKQNAKKEKLAAGKHAAKDNKKEKNKEAETIEEKTTEKPRRKRFSIYEDEYEEVEVPMTTEELKVPEGLEATKEYKTERDKME